MRYLNETEITNVICDYVNNLSYPHAIMLNGTWGVGKTYYVKRYLMGTGELEKRPIYLSLYGMKHSNEFWERIYAKLLDNKTGGIYSSDLLSLTKSGVSALLYQVGFLKDKSVKKVKDLINKLTKILIEPKNYFFILDDFERCTIPMQERLGVISVLLEEYEAKVLIIGNESEIHGDKEEVYKRNKEKVIGVTIPYQVPIEDRIYGLLKTDSYVVLAGKNKVIVDFCKLWEERNLRHVEYALDSFLTLKREIQNEIDEIKKYKDEIEEVLLKNVLAVAIHYRKNNKRREWNGDNLYEYTNAYKDDRALYGSDYAIIAFRFVESLIYDCYVDKYEVQCALSQYGSVLEHRDLQDDPINRLEKIFDMDEKTAEQNLKELLNNLKAGKYAYSDYRSIIVILNFFDRMGFNIELDKYIAIMKRNLKGGKYSEKVIGIRTFLDDSLDENYNRAIREIIKFYKEYVTNKTSLGAQMNRLLKDNTAIGNVEKCLNEIYKSGQGGILADIDIMLFADYIIRQDSIGIRKLMFEMNFIYQTENVKEYYADDKEKLEKLSVRLGGAEKEEKDRIKKYNLRSFAEGLEDIFRD